MKLHPAQKTIVEDKHRFRVVNAGRRFGKTVLAIEELLFAAVMNDNANIAYIAPTYAQAREIAWEHLKKRILDFGSPQINETRLETQIVNKFNSRSKITFKGWESIESLRGQFYDFIVLDEVAMYRDFTTGWQEVVRPSLTDRKGRVLFISTPKGFNFWYTLFNQKDKDPDYQSFHFTSYDNPHLDPLELDKARNELTEDRFAQEYLADFRKTEGLVYKEFDRFKHVFDHEKYNMVYKLIGIDWGYTNPSAVLSIVKDHDNSLYVISEWYHAGKTTDEILEYVQSLNASAHYPDPAEPDRIELMRRKGLNVKEVNKDVIAGIDAVREMFKQNKLFIHKSCVNLINELETYSYKEKRADQNDPEEPIKEHDHALDALRYVVFMQRTKKLSGVNQYIPTIIQPTFSDLKEQKPKVNVYIPILS